MGSWLGVQRGVGWCEVLQPRLGPRAGWNLKGTEQPCPGSSSHVVPHEQPLLNRWLQGPGINSDDRSVRLCLLLLLYRQGN